MCCVLETSRKRHKMLKQECKCGCDAINFCCENVFCRLDSTQFLPTCKKTMKDEGLYILTETDLNKIGIYLLICYSVAFFLFYIEIV